MSLENLAAGVVLLGLIAYAMFGGADFGGGVWTALAWGPRATQQREAIFRAMGPVWETNHVWLILVVVTLFTAFPSAFADLFTALLVPLLIALVGIVFRGAAFAFRHFGSSGEAGLPATGIVFSVASIITPMTMGMALGAVAGGHITIENGVVTSGLYEPWLRPFSVICGLIAVTMCGFLTAYYMATRSTGQLLEDFRKRGLAASLVLGALTTIAIPIAYWDADPFWDRLLEPAPLAVMGAAVVMGLASLVVLWQRWYVLAPPVAAGTVALVIAGWGAVQYPYLILPNERISDVAAGHATLGAFLIALPIGAVILIPSLVLLYATFSEKTGGPGVEGEGYGY
ncbi:MAG: cytochrome d ubiquinol oxidase subunit II [Chloroflexota bacterium]|nr:cytochrome d ubiquinol oxidase subunit II [Chloroflexota bacterium]